MNILSEIQEIRMVIVVCLFFGVLILGMEID